MAGEQPRNLVSSTIVAKICGLSQRRIQYLTKNGIIETVEDSNGGGRKYDLLPTLSAYIHYIQEIASGREQKNKEADLKSKKLKAEIALKESQGELHKLKTAIASGKYIDVEEVQLDYKKFFTIFKRFALAIPSRVGGLIGNSVEPVIARGIEHDISNDINSMLDIFVLSAKPKEREVVAVGEEAEEI